MNKQAQLEIATFLGSPMATAVRGIDGDELRRVISELVYAAHAQLGKRPDELDGQDLRALLLQHMPGIFEPKAATAERVPEIVEAFLDHLEQAHVPTYAFELRNALSESTAEYLALVRSSATRQRTSAIPRETFVHRASKLGRNDPCSCGSGKKFKKCHGKDA